MDYFKEVTRLKGQISSIEKTLCDEKFLSKAPEKVIELNKKKLADFKHVLERTMGEVMVGLTNLYGYEDGLEGVTSSERIEWYIQYLRDNKINHADYVNNKEVDYSNQEFDEKYFNYVYDKEIKEEEFAELLDTTKFRNW